LEPEALQGLLQQMVASHADCGTTAARVVFRLDVLRVRPALVTPELSGWQAYPALIEATLADGRFVISLATTVVYSSTCPCSAALARQVVQEAFVRQFGGGTVEVAQAAAWLADNASLATPHSQRSLADVKVVLGAGAALDAEALISRVEDALATAVQTAVKRADEQAFARLNGANLMYVEDAARRIQNAFKDETAYRQVDVSVRHLESLHPHDAVASLSWSPAAR
jgi:GTP cyclohydrolase I